MAIFKTPRGALISVDEIAVPAFIKAPPSAPAPADDSMPSTWVFTARYHRENPLERPIIGTIYESLEYLK